MVFGKDRRGVRQLPALARPDTSRFLPRGKCSEMRFEPYDT